MTFCVAVAAGVVGALEVVCCGVDTDVALYFIPALGDWETGRLGEEGRVKVVSHLHNRVTSRKNTLLSYIYLSPDGE